VIQRPFTVRCLLAEVPGYLGVRVKFSDHDQALHEAIAALDGVFASVERFGRAGGFAGNLLSPMKLEHFASRLQ
jgi:hypothetical protein